MFSVGEHISSQKFPYFGVDWIVLAVNGNMVTFGNPNFDDYTEPYDTLLALGFTSGYTPFPVTQPGELGTTTPPTYGQPVNIELPEIQPIEPPWFPEPPLPYEPPAPLPVFGPLIPPAGLTASQSQNDVALPLLAGLAVTFAMFRARRKSAAKRKKSF